MAADIFVGYTTLSERAKWLPSLVKPRDWELQHQRSANRVLETAASLGGALIKACQFASSRPDLLPAVYIRTLAPLQDRMPPRSWSEIEKAITRELGQRPTDVFAQIEREPVAAASIAQVHRARLHDGREVAVKVQYPDIENLVATDLAVLEQIVKAPTIQLQPIVDYLQETLPLELDFRHEAESMTALRTALAHRSDALIPAYIPKLSTERLLVMDYINGIKITDREALEQAGISPHEVARLLNELYAEQMLHLGILHADPHPGNLRVQPGPRLVLLDHGLTVPLAPSLVEALRSRGYDGEDLEAIARREEHHLSHAGDRPEARQPFGKLLGRDRQLLAHADGDLLVGNPGADEDGHRHALPVQKRMAAADVDGCGGAASRPAYVPTSSRKPATTRSATRRPRHPATRRAWMSPAKSPQARTAKPCLGASGNAEPLDSCDTSDPVAMAMERKMKPQTERCQPTRSIRSSEGSRAKSLPGCFDFSCFSLAR